MKADSKYIRMGFYEDFKGYDTVLISVDIHGLLEMESAFLQLSNGLLQVDFSTLKYLDKRFRIAIKAYVREGNSGIRQVEKGIFEWILPKEKWNQFRQMVTALYSNGTSGHQYLDAETGDIDPDSLQVVFSLDEYPLSFWQEHK
jgi:hypothetical protein